VISLPSFPRSLPPNVLTLTDERIREFLADSLKLWRVDGNVVPGEAPTVAVIRARDGTSVRVERRSPPLRWIVDAGRPRPCASIGGVLNALRGALGVERGEAVRVVTATTPGQAPEEPAA
jgi:hypothetical protein